MKIKVCHCKQCRAQKSGKRSSYKKRIKRYLNKLRRKDMEDTKVKNWYWA